MCPPILALSPDQRILGLRHWHGQYGMEVAISVPDTGNSRAILNGYDLETQMRTAAQMKVSLHLLNEKFSPSP